MRLSSPYVDVAQVLCTQEDQGSEAQQISMSKPTILQPVENKITPTPTQVAMVAVGGALVQEHQTERASFLAVPKLAQAQHFQAYYCGIEVLNASLLESNYLAPCIQCPVEAIIADMTESPLKMAIMAPECHLVDSTLSKAPAAQLVHNWFGKKVEHESKDFYQKLNCPMLLHLARSPKSSASSWLSDCEVSDPDVPQLTAPTLCDHASWEAFVTADMKSSKDFEVNITHCFLDRHPQNADFLLEECFMTCGPYLPVAGACGI